MRYSRVCKLLCHLLRSDLDLGAVELRGQLEVASEPGGVGLAARVLEDVSLVILWLLEVLGIDDAVATAARHVAAARALELLGVGALDEVEEAVAVVERDGNLLTATGDDCDLEEPGSKLRLSEHHKNEVINFYTAFSARFVIQILTF